MRFTILLRRLLLPLCLQGALFVSAAHAQNGLVTVHVPARPLGTALIEFAEQARLSISDTDVDFGNAAGNAVDGNFTANDALTRLLAGTGFTFTFVDSDTVRIAAVSVPVPPRPFRYRPPTENVVVTATKRPEVAQTVPYSISVTTGDELESLGARSSYDLTSQVAGLTATNLGPGEDKLFVRGLTDSVLPGLSQSMVGLYLDESRVTDDAPDPGLQLVDIDRVEVLRGPQGSLYGAGSLGGLVRIVTKRPVYGRSEFMAGATVAATEDGAMSETYDAILNLPLIGDSLALRTVFYSNDIGGYVDDTRLNGENSNRSTVQGGRAALGWQANDDWTVLFNFTMQDIRARDSQYFLKDLGPYKRDNYLREPHSDEFLEAGITAKGELGWADLVTNTSFLDRRMRDRFDASRAWNGLTGYPLGPAPFDYARSIRSFTNETRLTSPEAGPWKWLIGLFLAHHDEDFDSTLKGPDGAGTTILARAETREDRANEASLFGEVSFDFAPEFSLTAGARVFYTSRNVKATKSGFLATGSANFSGSNSQPGFAPKLVLQYRPRADLSFYAQYSEGYRFGGINVDGPPGATGEAENNFDSDELRNYELGAKTSFFEGRLVTDAALYYAIWRNVQSDQIAPDGAFFIENAGDVTDFGFELDVAAQPLRNLSVKGNFFWNNATLSQSPMVFTGMDSNLPGAPDISFGMSARYDVPLDSENAAFVSFAYGYVGTSHLSFTENSPAMGGYHHANIHFGFEHDGWQAVVFVDNLMNDHGNTFAFGNPFNAEELQVTPLRPRTVGLTLSWIR